MIYILGDIGNFNNELSKMFNNIDKYININDNIILLGDNFYPSGIKSLTDKRLLFFKKFPNINTVHKYAILGNHDYQYKPELQINMNIVEKWHMPNWYYKKKIKNMEFWFIDTCQLVSFGNIRRPSGCGQLTVKCIEHVHNDRFDNLRKKQLEWLSNSLRISRSKYKIVVGHYPIFTNGAYKNDKCTNDLREILFPIFKKYNVSMYISGHDHNSQHIPIKDNNYTLHNIICGNTSYTNIFSNNKKNASDFFYNKSNGYIVIDNNNSNNLMLRFKTMNTEIYRLIIK